MNTTVVNAYKESKLETFGFLLNSCNNKSYISKFEDPNSKIDMVLDVEVTGKKKELLGEQDR